MSVCPAGHGPWRAQRTTRERPSFAELQEGTWLPSWPDRIGFPPLTGPHSHLGQQEAEGTGKATAFTIAQASHTPARRTDSGADPSASVTYFLVQSLLSTSGHQPPEAWSPSPWLKVRPLSLMSLTSLQGWPHTFQDYQRLPKSSCISLCINIFQIEVKTQKSNIILLIHLKIINSLHSQTKISIENTKLSNTC